MMKTGRLPLFGDFASSDGVKSLDLWRHQMLGASCRTSVGRPWHTWTRTIEVDPLTHTEHWLYRRGLMANASSWRLTQMNRKHGQASEEVHAIQISHGAQ